LSFQIFIDDRLPKVLFTKVAHAKKLVARRDIASALIVDSSALNYALVPIAKIRKKNSLIVPL